MSAPTFTIADDGKSITCHRCGKTSHNANDVAFHYCGRCNVWHDGPNLLNAENKAAFCDLTTAIGRLLARTMPGAKFFFTAFQDPTGGQVGIDKFGVSVVTNLKTTELIKLLKGIVDHAEKKGLPTVIVRTE